MQRLYLYSYNNYYNRQIKRETAIPNYGTPLKTFENINFIPGNGIRTTHIINYSEDFTKQPNYVIVQNNDSTFTRWFVINIQRLRGFQYELTLKRDVIADYFSDVVNNSICIVQKGYVPSNSVLLYNKEQQNYNMIKQNEIFIRDKSKSGYIVGFIANNVFDSDTLVEGKFTSNVNADYTYTNITDFNNNFVYASYTAIGSTTPSQKAKVFKSLKLKYKNVCLNYTTYQGGRSLIKDIEINNNIVNVLSSSSTAKIFEATTSGQTALSSNQALEFMNTLGVNIANNDIFNNLKNDLGGDDYAIYNSMINNFDGKIVKIGTEYYNISISSSSTESSYTDIPSNKLSKYIGFVPNNISNYINNHFTNWDNKGTSATVSDIQYQEKHEDYYLHLTIAQTNAKITIPKYENRTHLVDAPYDMFMIPYSDTMLYTINGTLYTANKSLAINIAQAIGQEAGTSGSYDIQIVPYNPIQSSISSAFYYGGCDFSNQDYTFIKNGSNENIGAIIWCSKSSFKFQATDGLISVSNKKKDIDLKKYRLCSPDASSEWEFSPAMNDGVTAWNITCDYRPYSSYVKVQPKWGGVYASYNFKDTVDMRGLIFNGSYSVTQLSEAWSNYVASNKNYQAIFDQQISTQIKSYDLQNKAAYDTMFMRSYNLNPITAVASAWGNMREQQYNEDVQKIGLDNQKALYNLNLDNIQAQPNTISKLTSINQDFRIFPYVEVYSCSVEEERIYDDMIRYNGMTINVTGHISDYLKEDDETFIQAHLVRFYAVDTQDESDYVIVDDINRELNLGIYITKE